MKENVFEGQGKCSVCLREKMVHFIENKAIGKWRDICDSCESQIAPYLKGVNKPERKPEFIGRIRI